MTDYMLHFKCQHLTKRRWFKMPQNNSIVNSIVQRGFSFEIIQFLMYMYTFLKHFLQVLFKYVKSKFFVFFKLQPILYPVFCCCFGLYIYKLMNNHRFQGHVSRNTQLMLVFFLSSLQR